MSINAIAYVQRGTTLEVALRSVKIELEKNVSAIAMRREGLILRHEHRKRKSERAHKRVSR